MPDTFPFGQPVAWRPTPEQIADTNLARFWRAQGLGSYAELQAWALDDVGRFWEAALKDLGIHFSQPYTSILTLDGDGWERPQWCVDGRMSAVWNSLDRWRGTDAWTRDALRYESEAGERVALTYAELTEAVETCAAGLRALGLGPGDAVGLFMPMTPEIVVAFLAVGRIGGVILPLFSGYGAEAVATRLGDGQARALFVADGSTRRGRGIPMKPVADEALARAPTVEHVIVVPCADVEVEMAPGDTTWAALMAHGADAPAEARAAHDTAAEDPVMLIYTSGTTGTPKGALHTQCGFPVKAAQDMRHAMDVRPGDVVWWMSDMGWMMGPWLVFGALLCGATLCLYDGAPDQGLDTGSGGDTDPGRTWQLAERFGATLLGLSPTLVRALRPSGAAPVQAADLSALRAIGSTGSPWDPESWRWLFEHALESRKPILNYSGGTEISGGILCGNLVEPVKPCGFPGPVVGMDADVVDEAGRSVRGAVGELVIRQPWIGQTRGFWGDAGDARYRASYFEKRPGPDGGPSVWTHGDFATLDADGQWFILGRSDDTIKVAGKRLGPAEAESAVVAAPEVLEAAAVGVPDDVKGQALVLFVVLADGHAESDALRQALSARVTDALGKALRPKAVLFTDALPKTRNAKVMRRVALAAHLGGDLGNVTALEDPKAVDAIRMAR